MTQPQAIVLGRLVTDLYPLQSQTPLEQVRTFERFTGGYGGNVGIGLARLGVATAVVSGVGDDGHGRAIVRDLVARRCRHPLGRRPTRRSGPRSRSASCGHPTTSRCSPTGSPAVPTRSCAEADLPPTEVLSGAPIVYVSGSAFAQEPSRSTAFAALEARQGVDAIATILDLDWRPGYWTDPSPYPSLMRRASRLADTVIGSDSEFAAAGLTPADVAAAGARRVFVKHGPDGRVAASRTARPTTSRACRCRSSMAWAPGTHSPQPSARGCCGVCRGTACSRSATRRAPSWPRGCPAAAPCPRGRRSSRCSPTRRPGPTA